MNHSPSGSLGLKKAIGDFLNYKAAVWRKACSVRRCGIRAIGMPKQRR